MALVRQENQLAWDTVALESGEEPLRLDLRCSRVVILVAVNEKYGFVDLVGKQVGRHTNVGVLRLPDGPLLQLW